MVGKNLELVKFIWFRVWLEARKCEEGKKWRQTSGSRTFSLAKVLISQLSSTQVSTRHTFCFCFKLFTIINQKQQLLLTLANLKFDLKKRTVSGQAQ